MNKMNPARVDREDERRMLPCRNFLDGFCPRGNRCRFYHPLISSIPTVIRVPNLPASFQQNNFGQFPVHSGPRSVFSLSPSRSHMGMSPKLGGLGSPSANRFLGMNGFGNSYARSAPVPSSPTYSEYEMAYAQHMEIRKEKERRASAPPIAELDDTQDTVFSHINWREFLTPGARPPPPTNVPYIGANSPRQAGDVLDSIAMASMIQHADGDKLQQGGNGCTDVETYFAERMAAAGESYKAIPKEKDKLPSPPKIKEFIPQKSSRALSAKEELQMKVKQIAQELAAEPAQQVQSLDTFFRNYTFQSGPSSEPDLACNGSREIKEVGSDGSVPAITVALGTASGLDTLKSNVMAFVPKSVCSTSDSGISSKAESGDSACSVDTVGSAAMPLKEAIKEEEEESPTGIV